MRVEGALGGAVQPACRAGAAGPARAAGSRRRSSGAACAILERHARSRRIEPGRRRAPTAASCARAVVLRCLEGYTAGMRGQRRTWLPMNSAMIVDRAAADATRGTRSAGTGAELLGDSANAYCYAQRTADGRIALGGRGVPYRFGSRTDRDGRTQDVDDRQSLARILHALFPRRPRDARIDHAWCGVLGVPRDWCAERHARPRDRARHAPAATSAAASRRRTSPAARCRPRARRRTPTSYALPWVGHDVRRWEPEPLRWLGVRGRVRALPRGRPARDGARPAADSRLARVASLIAGR